MGETAKARKGTAWEHIRRVVQSADRSWQVRGGLSSGEGIISAIADPPPDKDGNPVELGDRRLMIVAPEFSRVLRVCARDSNILSEVIRESWDEGDLRVMTKTPIVATSPFISLNVHITIQEVKVRLTETDQTNGFANRIVWFCVRRSKLLPSGGNLDDSEIAYLARLTEDRLRAVRKFGRIRRTPEAEAMWDGLYHQIAADEPGGLLDGIVARADGQLLRFSLIYALLDGSRVIDVPHLEAAWALWQYCRASAAYIFGGRLGDDVADKLLTHITAAGPAGLDSTAQNELFGGHKRAKRIAVAREWLERQGLIWTERQETNGRPRLVSFACGKSRRSGKRWSRARRRRPFSASPAYSATRKARRTGGLLVRRQPRSLLRGPSRRAVSQPGLRCACRTGEVVVMARMCRGDYLIGQGQRALSILIAINRAEAAKALGDPTHWLADPVYRDEWLAMSNEPLREAIAYLELLRCRPTPEDRLPLPPEVAALRAELERRDEAYRPDPRKGTTK